MKGGGKHPIVYIEWSRWPCGGCPVLLGKCHGHPAAQGRLRCLRGWQAHRWAAWKSNRCRLLKHERSSETGSHDGDGVWLGNHAPGLGGASPYPNRLAPHRFLRCRADAALAACWKTWRPGWPRATASRLVEPSGRTRSPGRAQSQDHPRAALVPGGGFRSQLNTALFRSWLDYSSKAVAVAFEAILRRPLD